MLPAPPPIHRRFLCGRAAEGEPQVHVDREAAAWSGAHTFCPTTRAASLQPCSTIHHHHHGHFDNKSSLNFRCASELSTSAFWLPLLLELFRIVTMRTLACTSTWLQTCTSTCSCAHACKSAHTLTSALQVAELPPGMEPPKSMIKASKKSEKGVCMWHKTRNA